jgi:hypothetical protein
MIEEKIKNNYGIIIIAILAFFAIEGMMYVNSYDRSIAPNRTFAVSGEGKVTVVPDVANISFGVLTEGGKDIAGLTKNNNDKANLIIDSLKQNGVQEKDIVTQQYSIAPRYQYFSCNNVSSVRPCPPAEIVGYSVNQNVSVKIRDIKKAGDILNGVVSNGANNVSGLSFTVDDPTAVQNQARENAIAKAKETAGLIATAGGFGLGRIISVQEGFSSPQPMVFSEKAAIGSGASATIEPGTQDVQATITLIYEIR